MQKQRTTCRTVEQLMKMAAEGTEFIVEDGQVYQITGENLGTEKGE